ncbi:MAG: OsmC family protein [Hyphomicrobiales bacterium]|nr:OsmC family protein [Hyphomicrobiales bacterium]
MVEEIKRIPVVFSGRGVSSGKMRNDITVSWGHESWDLPTDEGAFHGGDGTAPPPLSYFTSAFIGCIMTQLRAFSKRLAIPLHGCAVSARIEWVAEQEGRNPYISSPVSLCLDIELDTPAGLDDRKRLVEAAKKGCFIDQTLAIANQVSHRLKAGEDWIEV